MSKTASNHLYLCRFHISNPYYNVILIIYDVQKDTTKILVLCIISVCKFFLCFVKTNILTDGCFDCET